MGSKINREKAEQRGSLLIKFMRFDEILEEHLHKDDLAGYHYVVPKEKLDKTLDNIKDIVNNIINELNLNTNENDTLRRLIEIRDSGKSISEVDTNFEDPEEILA